MFRLCIHRDCVEIKPSELGKDLHKLFLEKLNTKYMDKIIEGVGLVICVSQIIKYGQGNILRTNGSAIYRIEFSIAVFSPKKHQIVRGVICHSDVGGFKVSLGFYDDIIVTPREIKEPNNFDSKTGVWAHQGDSKVFYSVGSEINVKIVDVIYNSSIAGVIPTKSDREIPPMIILASVNI